jgi:hypothetical protein
VTKTPIKTFYLSSKYNSLRNPINKEKMASSKLLKEAIADAKAVRETAIANAKIALEEAFTPRLQSILSKKLQSEMEGEEEEADMNEDNDVSSEIGGGDNKMPATKANDDDTDLSGIANQSAQVGAEVEDYDKVKDLTEGEDEESKEMDEEYSTEDDEEAPAMEGEEEMAPEADEDELDLESIIRELEAQIAGEEGEEEVPAEAPAMEGEEAPVEEPVAADPTEAPAMEAEEAEMADDEIDLDEILREMGYGEDEHSEEDKAEDAAEMKAEVAKLETELAEALAVIKSLRGTINEVNLLNAKLLYTNKLFRGYNLTNEQKVKVVENLDRTTSVREVKLVYATLSESMKFTGTERKVAAVKKNISEGIASKAQPSTAPAKEIIAENTNELANRFKQLAGIIK